MPIHPGSIKWTRKVFDHKINWELFRCENPIPGKTLLVPCHHLKYTYPMASIPYFEDHPQYKEESFGTRQSSDFHSGESIRVDENALSDQPAEEDSLGFTPYVEGIAGFLLHTETKPPLTISVEGDWGSGKSSFLKQLGKKLQQKGMKVVWFNAWQHEKSETLWASFATHMLKELIRQSPNYFQRFSGRLRLWSARFDWHNGWLSIIMLLLSAGTFFLLAYQLLSQVLSGNMTGALAFFDEKDSLQLKPLVLSGGTLGIGIIVLMLFKHVNEYLFTPYTTSVKKHQNQPDYAQHSAFILDFHTDFKRIVDSFSGPEHKVFVFIDDLDRCELPKAAELMQAINQLIADSPRVIFVLAMDREKVAAALAVKNEPLLEYLGSSQPFSHRSKFLFGLDYGYNFMEKFIQLPFRIPEVTSNELVNMIGNKMSPSQNKENLTPYAAEALSIVSGQDSPAVHEIVKLVSESLENNPRRIKHFINLLRLKVHIASQTGLFNVPSSDTNFHPLTLERLGKFVAICIRWPRFLEDLAQNNALLERLQKHALEQIVAVIEKEGAHVESPPPTPEFSSEAEEYWYQQTGFLNLLKAGMEPQVDHGIDNPAIKVKQETLFRYGMTNMNIAQLIKTSPLRLSAERGNPNEKSTLSPNFVPA